MTDRLQISAMRLYLANSAFELTESELSEANTATYFYIKLYNFV